MLLTVRQTCWTDSSIIGIRKLYQGNIKLDFLVLQLHFLLMHFHHYCHFIFISTISNYRLSERHRLIAEGRLPPVSYEWEKELWAKRERFGTYGLASGINPEELWPTVEVRIALHLPFVDLFFYISFQI